MRLKQRSLIVEEKDSILKEGKVAKVHLQFSLIVEDFDIILISAVKTLVFSPIMARNPILIQILCKLLFKILKIVKGISRCASFY
jgi:hypothetical protein